MFTKAFEKVAGKVSKLLSKHSKNAVKGIKHRMGSPITHGELAGGAITYMAAKHLLKKKQEKK